MLQQSLPVEVDFLTLDISQRLEAIYRQGLRIIQNQEQIMKDASREAGETRESFAQLKEVTGGVVTRLMDKINTLTSDNATLKQQVADANETVVDAAEAAAISDQTQKDMQSEADALSQVGVDVVVPPPVEPPPSDGTEPPPAQ